MNNRRLLHDKLVQILGSRYVYYQPPESVRMNYPAIIYNMARIDNSFADDIVYMQKRAYQITVVDRDPESEIAERVSVLPTCRFDRQYASENLNHFVFTIYF